MVNRPAWWNLQKTAVTYQGISITMDQQPEENDSNREIGWWFARHPQNPTQLGRHNELLIEHVVNDPDLRALYLSEQAGDSSEDPLTWRPNSVHLCQELAQAFLKDLAVAIHFSAGPPVRAPEFRTPIWRNTERLRHIQLRYGQLMIHLVEHKMMATTGKNVNNIRFLCDELGELLVNYLVYVVPLLEAMAWQEDVGRSISPFLWSDSQGERWSNKSFGNMLKAACRRAGVPAIGTGVWRQMSSAIINTHFDGSDQAALLAAQDKDDDEEPDEEGQDRMLATLASMSNHSPWTHRMAYDNMSPFANVWDGKLIESHQASRARAAVFGLGNRAEEQSVLDRKRRQSLLDTPRSAKLLRTGQVRTKRHWSDAALLQEARKLYQNQRLRRRCEEQCQAMRLVANGSPEVLLVMATGAGKSLTFMLGSYLPGPRTTIVIAPLDLLRLDLIRRCTDTKLDPVIWKSREENNGTDGTSTLLFGSVEVAARDTSRQYVQKLYDMGNLERIMLDECHLVHSSVHYREAMVRLNELRQYAVLSIHIIYSILRNSAV